MPWPWGLPDSEGTVSGLLKPNALGPEASSSSSLVSEKVNRGASGKQKKRLNDWILGLFN